MAMVKMEIKGLLMDPVSNMPVVILRDAEDGLFLPIWVGLFEANAIALEMEKISTPRPMTHDLLKNVLAELDAHVDRVVINELKDNTFFARIHLTRGDTHFDIDSRPSDAIALALRSRAEIFVEQEVLEKSKNLRAEGGEPDPERLKKWLEEVSPEDLGKYKM
jgi:bifunctional DNase/RNase